MDLKQGILILKERGGGGRERESLKIEGGNRETKRGTVRQRDRADNKNPKQSWVAQLVLNRYILRMCLPPGL